MALALTDTLTLACTIPATDSSLATHPAPEAPMSPMALNVAAVLLPWHSALAEQLSMPVHVGGVVMTEHEPWHSPMQVADPGVYEQVPLHMPLHIAPAATVHLPVHIPLQVPPEN